MRRADPGHRAGGAIRFAPLRNDPLASAGRSAFALRGPTSPASLGRLSCACGAIRFCSARRSAPPCPALGFAALAIRSLPLARSGIYWGFGCAGCAGCAAAQPAGLVHSVVRRGPFKAPRNQPMEPGERMTVCRKMGEAEKPGGAVPAVAAVRSHLRHQAALAPRALPPRPDAPPVPQVITATRSPRSGRRPFCSPQSARRRRRLPGGAGLAPRSRSPPAPRRCG